MSYTYASIGASVLMIVLLAGAGGCKTGESASGKGAVPSDLEIIFGQQGTFAGRGMGYSINARGDVVRWEGKYPGEIEEARATIDSETVQWLWYRAEEIEFLSMRDQAMATAHSFISVSVDGESRASRGPRDPRMLRRRPSCSSMSAWRPLGPLSKKTASA